MTVRVGPSGTLRLQTGGEERDTDEGQTLVSMQDEISGSVFKLIVRQAILSHLRTYLDPLY